MHRLGHIGRRPKPEVGGHGALEDRRRPPAVGAARRRGQPGEPEVVAATPVPGDRAQGREPRPRAVGPDAHAVEPAPQTIATPQPRSVPARRTAKVSLRDRDATRPASPLQRLEQRPLLLRQIGARHEDLADVGTPPCRRAARDSWPRPRSRSRTSRKPSTPRRCGELPGPRTAARTVPSEPTSARSVFELPPSTASPTRGLIRTPPPVSGPTTPRRPPGARAAHRPSRTRRSADGPGARAAPARGSRVVAASAASRSYAATCWTSPRSSGASGRCGSGTGPSRPIRAGTSTTSSAWSPASVDPLRTSTSCTSPVSANREAIRAVAASL